MLHALRRALILLALAAPAGRADEACRDARAAYHDAAEEASRALHDYAQCLAASKGEDDCAVAYVDVEAAQRDFEAAVAAIRQDCR
jgi:hypothetical protein